jgi:hypothetical protein
MIPTDGEPVINASQNPFPLDLKSSRSTVVVICFVRYAVKLKLGLYIPKYEVYYYYFSIRKQESS